MVVDVLIYRPLECRRAAYLSNYRFPDHHWRKAIELLPGLRDGQRPPVEAGLRQFFLAALYARRRPVGMPSDAVDALWHAMILHTNEYRRFCRNAFGRFLEHQPNGVPGKSAESIRGELWRTRVIACRLEGLDPVLPVRLPLLFAADADLLDSGGWRYRLDEGRVLFRRGLAGPDHEAAVLYPENAARFEWVRAIA